MENIFLIFSTLFFNFPLISKDKKSQIKEDLALYRDVMEFFIMDDGFYLKTNSIDAFQEEVLKRQYAERINIKDPYGRNYKACHCELAIRQAWQSPNPKLSFRAISEGILYIVRWNFKLCIILDFMFFLKFF